MTNVKFMKPPFRFLTTLFVPILCLTLFTQCQMDDEELVANLEFTGAVNSESGSCNCDHVLSTSDTYIDANNMNIQPGDVICLEGGKRTHQALMNFQGTAAEPLTFINCNGQVVIENYNLGYGLIFRNSKHFKVTGTGDPAFKYGIKIAGTKSGASGVGVGDLSSDSELEFLEITNTGFAGIMAKTDPKCDGSANRGNFYMRNVLIHDNYIHDVGGEGLYIGNSFYSGTTANCGTTVYPHDIIGLRVYNNLVENTGWDGIQIGCASEDAEIYNNVVKGYGLTGSDAHTNGIQIGGGTTGKLYNNLVKDGKGNGIIVMGLGNNTIYNNLVVRPGGYGVFCDDRVTQKGSEIAFINNTFVEPVKGGFLTYSEVTVNKFYNNIITGSNSNISFGQGATGDIQNNILGVDLTDPITGLLDMLDGGYFVDGINDDFHLSELSPAVDAGRDVSSYLIDSDLDGNSRPVNGKFDIGSFECGSSGGTTTPPVEDPAADPSGDTGNSIVTASAYQDPNVPENTIDGNLSTRWSAEGTGQWIQYDLSKVKTISSVEISFMFGDQRIAYLDIAISDDATNWTQVYSGGSSGTTSALETFDFNDLNGQYVRITGSGNSKSLWNSFQEVVINTSDAGSSVPAEPVVLYRINAGGVDVAASPISWELDQRNNSSSYVNAAETNDKTYSTGHSIAINSSVPDVPEVVFQTQRYNGMSGTPALEWDFPVQQGATLEVRLYFAETYFQQTSKRIFDIVIEGTSRLANYDIFADAGHDVGVMKSFNVTMGDDNLDIDLVRVLENPAIQGIEIISN